LKISIADYKKGINKTRCYEQEKYLTLYLKKYNQQKDDTIHFYPRWNSRERAI